MATGFHLFQTAFGAAGLAWGPRGVLAVAFPGEEPGPVRALLVKRAPDAAETKPPAAVKKICNDIATLFDGGRPAFTDVVLDEEDLPAFDREVWRLTRTVPVGETRTYGDIARALGDVALSQRVGQALGRNPFPVIVPCHRVVGAGGRMTGFSAAGGVEAKRRLLKLEGAIEPELFD